MEITIRDIQAGTGLTIGSDNCSPACDQGPPNAGRSQDLDDLAAFLATLAFTKNPNLDSNDGLSEQALRGLTLFQSESTGCASCHMEQLYTDRQRHDVGSGGSLLEKKGSMFDTPSLRGLYKSAPYLHDGSAATLAEILSTANFDDQHGTTSQLDEAVIEDLLAFLNSPPYQQAFMGAPIAQCAAPPTNQSASLALQINSNRVTTSEQLTLTMTSSGEGTADLYVAIILPATASTPAD